MAAYALRLPFSTLAKVVPLLWLCAAILHSACCTINDVFDRKMDRLVERTKNRPVARGAVSVPNALLFFVAQMLAYLGLLTYAPPLCVRLALINIPMQICYPLFKRFTYWPSLFLGVVLSWGAMCGWSAVTGSIDWKVVGPLYLSSVCWSFGFDTIYGYQDRRDDAKAGVKSAALALGTNPVSFLYAVAAGFIVLLAVAGSQNGHGPFYYMFTVGFAAAHVYWQISTLNTTNPADCRDKFNSNAWIGWPMLIGLFSDYTVRTLA
ncbi:4-hydroxybenzoate hexaprenyltransferase [Ceratobasidium sp. AG-Ba]|nr:4-hydroxybenzoate hexaprenyltransferase [Ceratobasidium sp. AG-Ba]